MRIRELDGREDVRGTDRVNRRAWREGYRDVLSDELLDRDPATEQALDDRLAAVESWTGRAFVAVDEGRGDSDGDDDRDSDDDRDNDRDGDNDRPGDGERDGDVIGYAIVRWGADAKPFVADGDAGLKEIYVDPARWSEGVGTALLDRVERAVPDEYRGLTLSTLAGNERGRAFYEARGFEAVGEESDEIGGEEYDTVLFRKPL